MKRSILVAVLAACACGKPAPRPALLFTDATAQAGIHLDDGVWGTYGAAWADFDLDHDPDLFISRHASMPALLRNEGDGTFVDVTRSAAAEIAVPKNYFLPDRHGCAWGDFDADGFPDLYCTMGAEGSSGSTPNQLLRNLGNGRFVESAVALRVEDGPGRGRGVAWGDFDLDGNLDLYLANTKRESHPSRLYRREGDSFRDVTAEAGLADEVELLGSGAAWCDYDGDGYPDLVLAAYDGLVLHQNRRDGTFARNRAVESGIATAGVRSATCGDLDDDGHPDLYVAMAVGLSRFFRNRGDGSFEDATEASGLAVERATSSTMADFDNDGDTDVFVVRGVDPKTLRNLPDALFVNDGRGTFVDLAAAAGVSGASLGGGDAAAVADFDDDGFLDVLVTNGGNQSDVPYDAMLVPFSLAEFPVGNITTYPRAPDGSVTLFRNNGNGNHWIALRVSGVSRTAFGTRLRIEAGGRVRTAVVGSGTAGFAQDDGLLHFGLGATASVDRIAILWPDGLRQEIQAPPVDRTIDIVRERAR